jgi:hypothetical protein
VTTRRLYAEGTDVPVDRSRGEITGILTAHGVQRQAWSTEPEGDELLFELDGLTVEESLGSGGLPLLEARSRP